MKLKNKKILIIETFPDTPLIETSCEIALNLKKDNNVNFFWCGYDLPWKDWEISVFKKIIGFSFEDKIKLIEKILKKNNIGTIDKFDLNKNKIQYIENWSKTYNPKKQLKNFKYKEKKINVNLGISVESSLLSMYRNYDFKNDNEVIQKALYSSAIVFNRSVEIIKKKKPSAIITFNNRFAISRPIIEAAKFCKIKVIRHEVGSSDDKYEIFHDDVHNLKARGKTIYKYWKKTSKPLRLKNAKSFFLMPYKKTKKINTGSGKINSFSLKQDEKMQLPKDKKIVTFFTSSNYEFEALSSDLILFANSKDFKDQISALRSLVSIIKKLKNYFLVIRVHPSSKNSNFENSFWEKYKSKNIKIVKSESRINSFDLLKKSDYIVTYGSTLAVHAAYYNKPSITLRKHVFSCSKILIEPKNKQDLYKILKKKYFKNTKIKCLPYGNYIMSFGKKFKHFKKDIIFKGFIKGTMINNYGPFVNFILRLFYPILKFYKKNEYE